MTQSDAPEPHPHPHAAAWTVQAITQGIVCMVCGRPPIIERREVFYDTGLCRFCDADVNGPAPAAPPEPAP